MPPSKVVEIGNNLWGESVHTSSSGIVLHRLWCVLGIVGLCVFQFYNVPEQSRSVFLEFVLGTLTPFSYFVCLIHIFLSIKFYLHYQKKKKKKRTSLIKLPKITHLFGLITPQIHLNIYYKIREKIGRTSRTYSLNWKQAQTKTVNYTFERTRHFLPLAEIGTMVILLISVICSNILKKMFRKLLFHWMAKIKIQIIKWFSNALHIIHKVRRIRSHDHTQSVVGWILENAPELFSLKETSDLAMAMKGDNHGIVHTKAHIIFPFFW